MALLSVALFFLRLGASLVPPTVVLVAVFARPNGDHTTSGRGCAEGAGIVAEGVSIGAEGFGIGAEGEGVGAEGVGIGAERAGVSAEGEVVGAERAGVSAD